MKKALTFSLLLCALVAFSQEKAAKPEVKKDIKDPYLPQGNDQFNKKEYAAAEASYRISQSNTANAGSAYNLGNAIYKQKQPGEALYAYAKAIEHARDKAQKHKAFHNMGNALMELKNYQGAVEAYKNALRNDPADDETRYNYALAKDMLKKNPPKEDPKKDGGKDPKNSKDNKQKQPNGGDNKDKDKGDKGNKGDDKKENQDKDKGDKKDNNEDKGDNKDQKNGDGKDPKNNADAQPQNASPTKQRMNNMLDALNNEEKKVQEKANAKKVKGQQRQTEKDW